MSSTNHLCVIALLILTVTTGFLIYHTFELRTELQRIDMYEDDFLALARSEMTKFIFNAENKEKQVLDSIEQEGSARIQTVAAEMNNEAYSRLHAYREELDAITAQIHEAELELVLRPGSTIIQSC